MLNQPAAKRFGTAGQKRVGYRVKQVKTFSTFHDIISLFPIFINDLMKMADLGNNFLQNISLNIATETRIPSGCNVVNSRMLGSHAMFNHMLPKTQ